MITSEHLTAHLSRSCQVLMLWSLAEVNVSVTSLLAVSLELRPAALGAALDTAR